MEPSPLFSGSDGGAWRSLVGTLGVVVLSRLSDFHLQTSVPSIRKHLFHEVNKIKHMLFYTYLDVCEF